MLRADSAVWLGLALHLNPSAANCKSSTDDENFELTHEMMCGNTLVCNACPAWTRLATISLFRTELCDASIGLTAAIA